MVYEQTKAQYDALVAKCEVERPQLESTIRTDMDQIITSKEHLCSKIRGEPRGTGHGGGCATREPPSRALSLVLWAWEVSPGGVWG